MALMVTCSVLMWLTEVTETDGSIDGAHDHADGDLSRILGEDVATADPTLGSHQARTLERQQDLL